MQASVEKRRNMTSIIRHYAHLFSSRFRHSRVRYERNKRWHYSHLNATHAQINSYIMPLFFKIFIQGTSFHKGDRVN